MVLNVHNIEAIFRIILGLGMISLVYIGPQTPWGWLGAVLIGTGLIKFCPIYRLLGISTRKDSDSD